jgi:hypothetical protein
MKSSSGERQWAITSHKSPPSQNGHDLWAITCYFNPAGYRRRLANYRVFRQHLSLPLVAVELAYGPNFELDGHDADILVQLRGRNIMWQKERLLNVALQTLPSSCRKVVWLDCDVVFEADDWAERTSLLLDRFMLVQPFSYLHLMPCDWNPGYGRPPGSELRRSVPFLIASGMPVATCISTPSDQLKYSPGRVWASAREVLEEHHLYDACIIGGGDTTILCAAYGCFEDGVRIQHMNAQQRDHYLAWAGPFYDAVRAKIAFAEGNLMHLWHGKIEHRRYRERVEGFERFEFNPFKDIAVDRNGAWRWSSDKREMHDYVRHYFASRREDG